LSGQGQDKSHDRDYSDYYVGERRDGLVTVVVSTVLAKVQEFNGAIKYIRNEYVKEQEDFRRRNSI